MSHPLEAALREEGIACRVEVRDRLAVLIPDSALTVLAREARQRAGDLARRAGFTHVALDVGTDGATLPGR